MPKCWLCVICVGFAGDEDEDEDEEEEEEEEEDYGDDDESDTRISYGFKFHALKSIHQLRFEYRSNASQLYHAIFCILDGDDTLTVSINC